MCANRLQGERSECASLQLLRFERGTAQRCGSEDLHQPGLYLREMRPAVYCSAVGSRAGSGRQFYPDRRRRRSAALERGTVPKAVRADYFSGSALGAIEGKAAVRHAQCAGGLDRGDCTSWRVMDERRPRSGLGWGVWIQRHIAPKDWPQRLEQVPGEYRESAEKYLREIAARMRAARAAAIRRGTWRRIRVVSDEGAE